MRSPEKYLVAFVPAVALLAALGANRLGSDPIPRLRRTALLAALLLALAAAADLAPRGFAAGLRAGALHSAVAVLAVLFVQWLAPRRPRIAFASLYLCVGLDLGTAAWPLHRFGPAAILSEPPPTALAIQDDGAGRRSAPPRLYRGARLESSILRFPSETVQFPATTVSDNSGGPFGIANVPGYGAARSPTFVRLVGEGRGVGVDLLRLLAVDYALLTVESTAPQPRNGFTAVFDPLPGARLYRVDAPLPRVYLAGAATVASDDTAFPLLFTPEVSGGGRVILAPTADAVPLDGPVVRADTCHIDLFGTDRLEATCVSDRPAIAVFVEQYDVGWRATVDEVPVPLLRANWVARGVALAPGRHRIVLTFHPAGLAAGLVISGASLAALAACLLASRRRPGA